MSASSLSADQIRAIEAGCEYANASHIARVDPDTVRALCSLALEGLRLREATGRHKRQSIDLAGLGFHAVTAADRALWSVLNDA